MKRLGVLAAVAGGAAALAWLQKERRRRRFEAWARSPGVRDLVHDYATTRLRMLADAGIDPPALSELLRIDELPAWRLDEVRSWVTYDPVSRCLQGLALETRRRGLT